MASPSIPGNTFAHTLAYPALQQQQPARVVHSVPDSASKVYAHTVKLDELLERRVRQAMALEGASVFNEFAKSALVRKCRHVLQEHGVDPNSTPPGLKK